MYLHLRVKAKETFGRTQGGYVKALLSLNVRPCYSGEGSLEAMEALRP